MNLFIPLKTKVYYFDENMVSQTRIPVICPLRVKYLVGFSRFPHLKKSHIYIIRISEETNLIYEHVIPYSFILEMCK